MQISSVLAGYSDPAALGQRGETIEAAANRPAGSAEPRGSASPAPSAALAQILSRYDVKNISPAKFSEMVQKLREAGAITDGEWQQLAAIRLDLDAEGTEPDQPVNLVDLYAEKVRKLQRRTEDADVSPADRQQLTLTLRRLDWIEKFALMQSQPDAAGLNALA